MTHSHDELAKHFVHTHTHDGLTHTHVGERVVPDGPEVALHLAGVGAPVEVIDPPALLEEIRRLGRWAASAGPGSTGPTGAGPSGAGPAGAGPGTTALGSER